MPEILEIEMYRRLADRVVGRSVQCIDAPDDWYLKGIDAVAVTDALIGRRIIGTRRLGKLLLVDTDGPTIGLRFGMTGRLVVDGDSAIEKLEYASGRDDPAWERFALHFDDGGSLAMRDPRRLGGVVIEPDEEALGPDAWSISGDQLVAALAKGKNALKARLLDQKRVAGLGNLLTDEILWRADLAPTRLAGEVSVAEVERLRNQITLVLDELFQRGGSHMGDLQPERNREGHCPRDGATLRRDTIGGRTTYWCPVHQNP